MGKFEVEKAFGIDCYTFGYIWLHKQLSTFFVILYLIEIIEPR